MSSSGNGLETFNLGDFKLESGEILTGALLAYKTYGDPQNAAIINPTWYTGSVHDCAKNFSSSNVSLNPSQYFIVVPALFGNGESTSPSNRPDLGENFPTVTFADNVHAQYRLLTEKLGVKHAKAVVGWSMGAAQSYQWAVQYPDFMDCIAPICGSAKTAIHNNVFLEGVKSALIAARGGTSLGIGKGQQYPSSSPWTTEQRVVGLKALGRVYAGWGFSQPWYRHNHYTHFGARDAEDFIVKFWETWALTNDPEDALVMLRTWQLGDISALPQFGGDLKKALGSIKAKAVLAPCKTDLYFPPEDSEVEVDNMPKGRATLSVIPSIWGHWAGGPGDSKEDWAFLDEQMGRLLSEV
ncbi:homoserine acetyltransferase family protein [Eremomyces bilateralis CBS 781.70]|uniref:Homoserine acetyltransferase family protein n=1 Tax=Eremomyces bilateralis CBS 781.70 TaxID=1392243 RepID=A0A6G1FVX2_9PEZI|nr:homoserine acetyltransferase family protein [Eremomyces bilateralis CBS 781.70]KAF1810055.1 homoserine acetyltransferase family protein [Eremomyces bilateralis CBS 781.70]